jgi:hypothetical protein
MHVGYWWEARRKETTRKIKYIKEIELGDMNWIDLAQDRDQ